ncbi:MAG: hypothetical protein ACYC3L_07345 [Gemmatimonadaceae bacterium]
MRRRLILAAALAVACATAVQAGAQAAPPLGVHPGAVGESRSVAGRVIKGGDASAKPVAGSWVVLHRVGTDRAGPLDSVKTDAAGRYSFRYRTSGEPNALYFVSGSVGGIAYFTSPFKDRNVRGDAAELVTYDTITGVVPIRVRARHLVVSAPDSTGHRTIVEIFELSNDTTVTRIAGGDTLPVWESGMLEGASDPRVGQADFSAEAVRFTNGRIRLFAPFAPGLKQISYSYVVPAKARDFSLLVDAPATVLEVLVEDPLAKVEGPGITPAPQAALNGRSFARFLAQDVKANTIVRVHAPTEGVTSGRALKVFIIVAALGAVLLVGLASAMMRRPLSTRSQVVATDSASLRTQLAALEEAFGNLEHPTAEQRADHWQRRAHLKQQLSDVLAREQGLA